jgi:transposase
MDKTLAYFRYTTFRQRKLLFETWEASGSVTGSCHTAHVGRRTFYNWKARFEQLGYAGLEEFASRARIHACSVASDLKERVIEHRKANPSWGKLRIAQELAKENNWVPNISPNTVRHILQEVGLWPPPVSGAKQLPNHNRTAEEAGETINIDLCFVPVEHEPQVKLPAVSGSSGRLIVEGAKKSETEKEWPGCLFDNTELDYTEVMRAYIDLTRERLNHAKSETVTKPGRKAEKQALRRIEEALRDERYQVRERCKQEDSQWRAYRKQLMLQQSIYQGLGKMEQMVGLQMTLHQEWRTALEKRRACLQKRATERVEWKTRRQASLKIESQPGWFAILVITDNCTRQCLGLPLFVAGAKVTSEMVTTALKELLPPELKFVISDQGSHFRSVAFAQLAQQQQFIWVPVARHRPESNGIAERFVRTLKEWLADKLWKSALEFSKLLVQFIPEYNERPHQGLPIPGLSPNEYANRLWLM